MIRIEVFNWHDDHRLTSWHGVHQCYACERSFRPGRAAIRVVLDDEVGTVLPQAFPRFLCPECYTAEAEQLRQYLRDKAQGMRDEAKELDELAEKSFSFPPKDALKAIEAEWDSDKEELLDLCGELKALYESL